jgi:hypothetical protein
MTPLAIDIRAEGVAVAPGNAVSFAVDVVNLRSVVDRYRCEIVGMPAGWWSVKPGPRL